MSKGKQLFIDYVWDTHEELKHLLKDVIPYCIRKVAPETGQHVIIEPYEYFTIRFRCTDDLEVNQVIFDRAVAICAKDEKKTLVHHNRNHKIEKQGKAVLNN